MDSLLKYIKELRITPGGNKITATQKLALCLFVLEGKGGLVEFNAPAFANYCLLSTTRSAYRLIEFLENEGLILSIPQRDEKGHKRPALIHPLPKINKIPSDIHDSKTAPSDIHDTTPTVMYVTTQAPSDKKQDMYDSRLAPSDIHDSRRNGGNSFKSKELDKGNNGTEIALKTPPLPNIINTRGEGLKNGSPSDIHDSREAIDIWFKITGEREISSNAVKLISQNVFNIPVWERALQGYCANPRWGKTNIDAQLERYDKKLKAENQSNISPLSTSGQTEKTPEQQAEDDFIKELIYQNDRK